MKFKSTKKKPLLRVRKTHRKRPLGAVTIALLCVCGAVFLFSCYKLIGIFWEYRKGAAEYEGLSALAVRPAQNEEDAEASPWLEVNDVMLRARNADYVGWIEIPDTAISYPMVQGYDNAYYLRRSFDGESYLGGVIFLDYLCGSDFSSVNTIIYGHHMLDGSMFAPLADFVKPGYLEAHDTIHIYTEHSILVYRVFAAYQTDIADSCYTVAFADDSASAAWLGSMLARGAEGTETPQDARILTLSTCTNVEKADRYVVQAVLEQIVPR